MTLETKKAGKSLSENDNNEAGTSHNSLSFIRAREISIEYRQVLETIKVIFRRVNSFTVKSMCMYILVYD